MTLWNEPVFKLIDFSRSNPGFHEKALRITIKKVVKIEKVVVEAVLRGVPLSSKRRGCSGGPCGNNIVVVEKESAIKVRGQQILKIFCEILMLSSYLS